MHAQRHEPASRAPSILGLGLASLAVVTSACRIIEPPSRGPPPVSLAVRHFAGTPLSGPAIAETLPSADAADVVSVAFRLVHLERAPSTDLPALASRTRLIATSRGEEPVLAATELARGARVGTGEAAERFLAGLEDGTFGPSVELASLAGALPKLETGVTVVFSALSESAFDVLDVGPVQTRFSVCVARAGDRARARDLDGVRSFAAVLVVEGRGGAPDPASTSAGSAPSLLRELIALGDEPTPGSGPLVVVLRSPFAPPRVESSREADTAGYLVAVLSLEPLEAASDVPDDLPENDDARARADAFARCLEELALDRELAPNPPEAHGAMATLSKAFVALEDEQFHRSGLLFLATVSGARLAEDVALTAEEPELAAFVDRIRVERGDSAAGPGLDWLLERSAYQFLITSSIESPPIARELSAALLRHAGEVGRYPGFLREIVASCTDSQGLEERLVAANEEFLEEQDPSARMRAFDWLAARGRAPEGYDPLALEDARRAALARARMVPDVPNRIPDEVPATVPETDPKQVPEEAPESSP